MENRYLTDIQELLTEQMIKEYFKSKTIGEDKFIITMQDLYNFSLKLISFIIANNTEYTDEDKK